MRIQKSLAALALAASALPLSALAGDMGTGYAQFSSNGLGLGYGTSISSDWAVRGQYNTFKQSFSGDVGDFGAGSTLTVDLNLSSLQVLADWYPSDGGFRVSGGAVFNNNKITVTGTGNVNSKPATVNGEIKMSDGMSPYIGIGYSTKPKDAKGFGFIMDLGVMFQNPKSTLTATGTGVVQSDIDAQNAKVQDAIDKLKTMPVFGIGVSYSF